MVFSFGPAIFAAVPEARAGRIDLSEYDFSRGPALLDGQWEILPGRLVEPARGFFPPAPGSPSFSRAEEWLPVQVPGLWTAVQQNGAALSAMGCATYRLRLKLDLEGGAPRLALKMPDAGTSYRLFLNGREIGRNGAVSCEESGSHPQYLPTIIEPRTLKADNEILVQVSNFAHHKAGLWASLKLGLSAELFAARERAVWTDIFLTGGILMMALYHFGLFFLRRKDVSSLFFGLMCLLIILRMLITGERLLFIVFPDFHFEIGQKIEYLSIYLAVPLFVLFFYSLFPGEVRKWVAIVVVAAYGALGLFVLATPLYYYSQSLLIYFAMSVVMLIYGLVMLPVAMFRKREGALAALIGFVLFAVAAVNDMLYTENVISSVLLLPLGLFAFIFSQSFMLSLRFSSAFLNVERLSDSLQETAENLYRTNMSYSRFVPAQFLSLLQKEDIREIDLGDQTQREMSVLFSDISAFTELSELMTPKENFDFLNSYLRRMHPSIDQNNGFVDKYIGDSIMALFPDSALDAVQAAVDMQQEIRAYNRHRMEQNFLPIGVRIGIHTGSLMLGTIGSEARMEPTVISDSVNVASRIEGLNKQFGTYTLMSEETLGRLPNENDFEYRRLGKVRVKGKSQTVTVYELFNGLSPVVFEPMIESRESFERGLSALEAREYDVAREGFLDVLNKNPGDRAAAIYLERAQASLA